MIPDKRKQRLNAFRHATKICCALLLVFGAVYFSVAILPIALNPEGNPELIRHFNTNLLLLNGITLAQILIASLMSALQAKRPVAIRSLDPWHSEASASAFSSQPRSSCADSLPQVQPSYYLQETR